jgi:hypothetical protein
MSSWRLPGKKKKSFKISTLVTELWLNLAHSSCLYDDDSQSTYFTILGTQKKTTRGDDDDVDTERHKISP